MASLYQPLMSNDHIKLNPILRWKRFCIDFDCWNLPQKKLPDFNPVWEDVKFERANKNSIPDKQGIYAFVIRHPGGEIINHNQRFILYIGQTINLRQRFSQYFGYKNSDEPSDQLKREMVLVWEDYLYFHYFVTDSFSKVDLKAIEYDLIDFIVPPINEDWRADYVISMQKHVSKI